MTSVVAPPRKPLRELLALCSWGWPFGVGLVGGGVMWVSPAAQFGPAIPSLGGIIFFVGVLSGPVWFVLSRFAPEPRRVILRSALVALLLIPFVAVIFGFMSIAYFIAVPRSFTALCLQLGGIAAASAAWIYRDVRALARAVVQKKYVEREFDELDDHVTMCWTCRTDVFSRPAEAKTNWLDQLWARYGDKFLIAIAPLAGAGYAIARLLDRGGGLDAVLLVMATLGIPFCVAMLSQLARATYLNIYVVRQVERRSGKKVFFDHVSE